MEKNNIIVTLSDGNTLLFSEQNIDGEDSCCDVELRGPVVDDENPFGPLIFFLSRVDLNFLARLCATEENKKDYGDLRLTFNENGLTVENRFADDGEQPTVLNADDKHTLAHQTALFLGLTEQQFEDQYGMNEENELYDDVYDEEDESDFDFDEEDSDEDQDEDEDSEDESTFDPDEDEDQDEDEDSEDEDDFNDDPDDDQNEEDDE